MNIYLIISSCSDWRFLQKLPSFKSSDQHLYLWFSLSYSLVDGEHNLVFIFHGMEASIIFRIKRAKVIALLILRGQIHLQAILRNFVSFTLSNKIGIFYLNISKNTSSLVNQSIDNLRIMRKKAFQSGFHQHRPSPDISFYEQHFPLFSVTYSLKD